MRVVLTHVAVRFGLSFPCFLSIVLCSDVCCTWKRAWELEKELKTRNEPWATHLRFFFDWLCPKVLAHSVHIDFTRHDDNVACAPLFESSFDNWFFYFQKFGKCFFLRHVLECFYFQVSKFSGRFKTIPDMLEADHLTVSGDVTFGKDVSLKVRA